MLDGKYERVSTGLFAFAMVELIQSFHRRYRRVQNWLSASHTDTTRLQACLFVIIHSSRSNGYLVQLLRRRLPPFIHVHQPGALDFLHLPVFLGRAFRRKSFGAAGTAAGKGTDRALEFTQAKEGSHVSCGCGGCRCTDGT